MDDVQPANGRPGDACRGVRATLCYDRPPPHFRPTPLEEAHELLQRLRPVLAAPLHPHDCVAAMYEGADEGQEVHGRPERSGLSAA